jgi:hypothetical protein
MELHYLTNPTVGSLTRRLFLGNIPPDFRPVGHRTIIFSEGRFDPTNYQAVLRNRAVEIQRELERRIDGTIMLWSDVDLVFFQGDAARLSALAQGKDLLLIRSQSSQPGQPGCSFSFLVIRRTLKTLIYFSRISALQQVSDDCSDESWGECLLELKDSPKWGLLPDHYAAGSLRDVGCESMFLKLGLIGDKAELKRADEHFKSALEAYRLQGGEPMVIG